MKLSTPKYVFCFLLQLFFIITDLTLNCISLFPRSRDSLLVIFIFQDLFLVFSITTVMMLLFSTYLFQAGLVELLWRRFAWSALLAAAYVAASVALHAASLARADHAAAAAAAPLASSPLVAFLFTVQKCLCPWYYYAYKLAMLRVPDPRLYDDVGWLGAPQAPQAPHATHATHAAR